MPNVEVKSTRPSPYWRHASPPRRTTTTKLNLSSEQTSNRVGQQLLRTLTQSLPSGQETMRSRSSCPPTPRRRREASVCRSMGTPQSVPLISHGKAKTPIRLKAGMPVKQVLGGDPPNSKALGQSVMAPVKRRNESPTVKAKIREEQYNKIPEMVSEASVAKAREKEFERIPSRVSSLTEENQQTEEKTINITIPETQENSKPGTKTNSKDNLQTTSSENSKPNLGEEKPTENIAKTQPKPPEPSNSKIIPCFRGEYPTRHRLGTCQWFQTDVPDCGNIVTICDEEQQVMGEAEIVTACEVTEAHFLSLDCQDDMNSEPPPLSRCNKCMGCPQQQNGNWFGQQRSCLKQPQPCFQQQQPCLQQQPSCFQQQQRNCGRSPPCPNAKPRGGLKYPDQQQSGKAFAYNLQQSMQQPMLPQMQNMYPCQQFQPVNASDQMEQQMQLQPKMQQQGIEENNYGLTEMLAEELKKQMLEAQAQIAQVQLQLNSACGATRVRQMHVLSQNATEAPRWAPETQFMDALAEEQDVGDAPPDATIENGEEDQVVDARLDQHSFPASFPCQAIESTRSETIWAMPAAPQSSQPEMQFGLYPMPLSMPNQNNYFQRNAQQFPCQMAPFQQPQQQQMAHCQQIQSCRAPPCPPKMPPPCQQKQQQRLSCQQQQQQQPMRSGQPAQSNKCSHSPQFCPSCCCQRYAQMRFMMPRCWLR
ncbi:uncharacterized protein LOC6545169 [Drosophila erecta]|uniref:Uncharacterized protein n=1 Tax=Drosophila erecta TaxID=7220 RepID=B3NCU7_DROER|nr:uncharacterized protein LOC6545169 [Drosophila erecta]EDV51603.2 uncharacterized protein Dere_GG13804 [Drosophila erecta]